MNPFQPAESCAFAYDIAFLQIISDISALPAALWSKSFFWSSNGLKHPAETDQHLRGQLENGCPVDRSIVYFETEYVVWGLLRIRGYCIALGPAVRGTLPTAYGQEYAAGHGMSSAYSLKKAEFGELKKYLALISYHFLGYAESYDEITMSGFGFEHIAWESEGDLAHYQLAQSEYDRSHKSGAEYEDELALAVRNGDLVRVRQLTEGAMPDIDEVGVVADDPRKQLEYMVVSLITILTRAAVEGGLRSETAHELGDIYLKRLAATSLNGGAITTLGIRAIYEFAERVHLAQAERKNGSHVEACKFYIDQNLCKDIKVGDIAPALGVSRTYLARLFKNEEGITIQKYIQREKCRHAERLLVHSNYSIALISEYFGFSSPSYFNTCFQQWYGTPPSAYRRMNFRK